MLRGNPIIWPGKPYPLGATWDGEGVNFSLFSEHAEKVELCLFDSKGKQCIARIPMRWQTDQIWHCYLPQAEPGLLYGYRVYGEYRPEQGLRFNPNKLLLDPYAKAITGPLIWSDALFGYRIGHPRNDLSFDRRDSALGMPKCKVIDSAFTWGEDKPPRTPWHDTVIYELHVKGFTINHPEVPPNLRGTFAGLATTPVIEYLKRLGITAVELMPIHSFLDDRHLIEKGLRNYWGYNSFGYFAPDYRYLASDRIREFKTMVKRLHSAGIEVILDVVYNHSAEGNHLGPTLSFRGIDNLAYYRLGPENLRYYVDFTGCGNTLNMTHPRVLQLIMDSLRYWVLEMHVDGFRFDLASALARELFDVDRLGAFFDIIHQDPVLSHVKLIAEPWDLGRGGYQVGNFPIGWTEWNAKYRDAVRAYWKGDGGLIGELAFRLTGSSDLYEKSGRRPCASINFVTAHDGFTLHDLVSYNKKRNQANLEDNRDGENNNLSWNCGASDSDEGLTEDLAIQALRERQKRNFLATLLLSQGVPMLIAGDEIGRTQNGNNNAYCQDNATSWIDWRLTSQAEELLAFVRNLIQIRKAHAVFHRRHFFQGRSIRGADIKDLIWLNPEGQEMSEGEWNQSHARALGVRLSGEGLEECDDQGREVRDDDFFLALNAHHEAVEFVLPSYRPETVWRTMVDTDRSEPKRREAVYECGSRVVLQPRSLALLRQEPAASDDETKSNRHAMPFGTEVMEDGRVRFRLWAPACERVDLHLGDGEEKLVFPMAKRKDGWFEFVTHQAGAGSRYRYHINGETLVPDPASRFQPDDVHGASLVINPNAWRWSDDQWRGRPWEEAVIYEVHVGTFSESGTFRGVQEKLDYLVSLGVTALQLMPLADFPGSRNWGYDGVLPFAPDSTYGEPDDLKDLINAAHNKGLMVFLDVVYNHFGPDGNYLHLYAPQFFTDRYQTPWGTAINFEDKQSRVVRDFFIHNAIYWIEEFHIDGLRLDAVHAIFDRSVPDILEELAITVRKKLETKRLIHLILENDNNASRYLSRELSGKPKCYTAQWNDDLHHALHLITTGQTSGYYADYADRPAHSLGRCLTEGFAYQGEPSDYRGGRPRGEPTKHLPLSAFVSFLQNHDQVGNRALGERITELASPEAVRTATEILLLSPAPPLLFAGQEWGSRSRFLFFCDFGPHLAEAVTRGRRNEFSSFPEFSQPHEQARIPDPNAQSTFVSSKLNWRDLDQSAHQQWLDLHRRLLALRQRHIAPLLKEISSADADFRVIGERSLRVRWISGNRHRLTLLANLGNDRAPISDDPAGVLIYSTHAQKRPTAGPAGLEPWSTVWYLESQRG
ncbi:MAG: glycogen debranching protein GlgX [Deltaproteobacteria bacterium]|nr:glycogen debranching protein GlgX [Deltaproteobacteria bacterium]